MRKYTFTDRGFTFERVNRATARRAYNNGLRVLLCPCNLRPGAPYYPEVYISGKAETTFEEALNAFEYYNIGNSETGFYTSFFIPVVTVDRFTGEAPTDSTTETVQQYDYRYIGGSNNERI